MTNKRKTPLLNDTKKNEKGYSMCWRSLLQVQINNVDGILSILYRPIHFLQK